MTDHANAMYDEGEMTVTRPLAGSGRRDTPPITTAAQLDNAEPVDTYAAKL
jgi:hypothetical protein